MGKRKRNKKALKIFLAIISMGLVPLLKSRKRSRKAGKAIEKGADVVEDIVEATEQ